MRGVEWDGGSVVLFVALGVPLFFELLCVVARLVAKAIFGEVGVGGEGGSTGAFWSH